MPADAGGDASVDAPDASTVDAQTCFGTGLVKICLAAAPTQPLVISNLTTIDTTTSPMCVATVSGGANYCVLAGTTITIDAKLRATGSRPLVLIASDSITTGAVIDVGSHRGPPRSSAPVQILRYARQERRRPQRMVPAGAVRVVASPVSAAKGATAPAAAPASAALRARSPEPSLSYAAGALDRMVKVWRKPRMATAVVLSS